jgi:hypothetical protein
MLFWLVLLTIYLGIVVFAQALKHSWDEWYYGRLNRKTFERWRNERR